MGVDGEGAGVNWDVESVGECKQLRGTRNNGNVKNSVEFEWELRKEEISIIDQ